MSQRYLLKFASVTFNMNQCAVLMMIDKQKRILYNSHYYGQNEIQDILR